jgi:predicted amidophosphoribosyltransferase
MTLPLDPITALLMSRPHTANRVILENFELALRPEGDGWPRDAAEYSMRCSDCQRPLNYAAQRCGECNSKRTG